MSDGVLTLPQSVSAWHSPRFRQTLIEEIQGLGPDHPALQPLLQNGLTQTSVVADSPFVVHLLSQREQDSRILAHLGLFYAGIIAGCSCADDPSPVDSLTEHCELLLDLSIATGEAHLIPWDQSFG